MTTTSPTDLFGNAIPTDPTVEPGRKTCAHVDANGTPCTRPSRANAPLCQDHWQREFQKGNDTRTSTDYRKGLKTMTSPTPTPNPKTDAAPQSTPTSPDPVQDSRPAPVQDSEPLAVRLRRPEAIALGARSWATGAPTQIENRVAAVLHFGSPTDAIEWIQDAAGGPVPSDLNIDTVLDKVPADAPSNGRPTPFPEIHVWPSTGNGPGPIQLRRILKQWNRLRALCGTFQEINGTHGDPASQTIARLATLTGHPPEEIDRDAILVHRANVVARTYSVVRRFGRKTYDNAAKAAEALEEAWKLSQSTIPTVDNRISPEERAERDRAQAERLESMRQEQAEAQAKAEALRAIVPNGAKRLIYAVHEEDQSDGMTDYYGSRRTRTALIGFSWASRNSFQAMRDAARRCTIPAVQQLADAPKDAEHRDDYSMGRGLWLGAKRRYETGWYVQSTPIDHADHILRDAENALPQADPTPDHDAQGTGYTIRRAENKRGAFWLVVPNERTSREAFEALRDSAKTLGGWYSRKWGRQPGGFGFDLDDRKTAEAWAAQHLGADDDTDPDGTPAPVQDPDGNAHAAQAHAQAVADHCDQDAQEESSHELSDADAETHDQDEGQEDDDDNDPAPEQPHPLTPTGIDTDQDPEERRHTGPLAIIPVPDARRAQARGTYWGPKRYDGRSHAAPRPITLGKNTHNGRSEATFGFYVEVLDWTINGVRYNLTHRFALDAQGEIAPHTPDSYGSWDFRRADTGGDPTDAARGRVRDLREGLALALTQWVRTSPDAKALIDHARAELVASLREMAADCAQAAKEWSDQAHAIEKGETGQEDA